MKRGPETLGVVQQFPFPPLAYFEKETGTIYVDRERRSAIIARLGAQVSGGIWTFDMAAGRGPVEAKEEPLENWDRTRLPQIGDHRIASRSRVTVELRFKHLPIFDAEPQIWADGKPIVHDQCVGKEIKPGIEGYGRIGFCREYADPDCTQPVGESHILNWAAL